jgi:hypothetical protein
VLAVLAWQGRGQGSDSFPEANLLRSKEHVDRCLDISANGVHCGDHSRVPGALDWSS